MIFSGRRSKSGFTVSELLVAAVILSLITAVIAAVSASAARSAEMNSLESRFLLVSDTVNTAVRDILSDSEYAGDRDGGAVFINERYSPSEARLEDDGGVMVLRVFSGEESEVFTPLTKESYGGFSLGEFKTEHTADGYLCSYVLTNGSFSERVSLLVKPLGEM